MRLKIPKGGNQNPYIEKKQKTQWPKEKVQNVYSPQTPLTGFGRRFGHPVH